MFFILSLCCLMLSYSYPAVASAPVISPIKTAKNHLVIKEIKLLPQCSFYAGGALIFVGVNPKTGNTQMSVNIPLPNDGGFIDFDITIPPILGNLLCFLLA